MPLLAPDAGAECIQANNTDMGHKVSACRREGVVLHKGALHPRYMHRRRESVILAVQPL